jgi:AcrR family transcriptional regulator
MPRAALTDEQIATFRERAVEAATRLFATEGYDAVTMRALASELGVSAMTPYRYFEDKEELFALVRTDAFRRFADRQSEVSRADEEPRTALAKLGRAYIQFALDEPDAYRIMFELRQQTTRPYPELEAEQKRAFLYIRSGVEDAVEAGKIEGDPLTVAHLAWAQVHGVLSLHLAGKLIMGRSVEELIDAALPVTETEK